MDIKDKTIVVWFSCGAASAVAAKKTVEKYGQHNDIIIANTPIHEEDDDNRRFLNDIAGWIGLPINKVTASKYPDSSIVEVFGKKKYMSGIHGAPCTTELKKQARYEFETTINIDYHVLGFTADEKHRHERFITGERNNVIPVLIDENISKKDCFDILRESGIKLPRIYGLGFPNANCVGCVKSTSVTYWNLVRKKFPNVFAQRAIQSRDIGCKLVIRKGKRIYLDQLLETDRGNKIKSWDCGIFCDKY